MPGSNVAAPAELNGGIMKSCENCILEFGNKIKGILCGFYTSLTDEAKEIFYVLNTKTGYTKKQHESEQSARAEAERLAKQQPGDIFLVLKMVSSCFGKVNVE